MRSFYVAVGVAPPAHFLWRASPLEAVWTFGALSENHDGLTANFMQFVRQRSGTRAKLGQVQAELQSRLGAGSWQETLAAVGEWQSVNTGFRPNAIRLLPALVKTAQTTWLMGAAGLDGLQQRYRNPDPAWMPLQAAEREVFGHFGDGILAYGAPPPAAPSRCGSGWVIASIGITGIWKWRAMKWSPLSAASRRL